MEAIEQMLEKINITGKINVSFFQQGFHEKNALKQEDKIAVFRIIQEQLSNILKHAKATKACISLLKKQQAIFLSIEDNGIGFDTKLAKKGIGLKNIYHRVEYYRGTLDIKTAKGKGCKMKIVIQL